MNDFNVSKISKNKIIHRKSKNGKIKIISENLKFKLTDLQILNFLM